MKSGFWSFISYKWDFYRFYVTTNIFLLYFSLSFWLTTMLKCCSRLFVFETIVSTCYIVICWFMQKYTYIGWIHTDAIIIKTPDDKVARTNDARKEDAGRLLYNTFYLSSLFVSFERVVQSLRVRGSWRPNITEIFGPRSYGRHRCVFLVLYGCSTEHWESTLRGAGFSYYIASISSTQLACLHWLDEPNWPELNCPLFNSSALYYLQTPTQWYGHASATSSDI